MNEILKDLVSIVLPVYNGEKYLSLSIESCLNQSYQNIELIIVNDCSTDSTLEIANQYAQIDARVKVVNNIENKKLPASLNIGHKLADGAYITWTSDDNIYETNAIEELVNDLIENNAEVVYSDFFLIDNFGKRIKEVELLGLENLIFGNFIGASFLYKKEVFEKNNGYDETLFLLEDYDFWLRALIHSKYYKVNKFLYNYRSHDKSLSSQISTASDKKELWKKNTHKMYYGFSSNFIEKDSSVFSELQAKILMYEKIEFKWIINNYAVIKKFQDKMNTNKNFADKYLIGNVFLKNLTMIMTSNAEYKKSKFFCLFIFRKYFLYLDKNSLKTLIKYSFFK
jgi:glycosyltransferase involved in cell wall biosynthesis